MTVIVLLLPSRHGNFCQRSPKLTKVLNFYGPGLDFQFGYCNNTRNDTELTFRIPCKLLTSFSHVSILVILYSIHWFTSAFSSAVQPTTSVFSQSVSTLVQCGKTFLSLILALQLFWRWPSEKILLKKLNLTAKIFFKNLQNAKKIKKKQANKQT